jgi:hypothetical protein
VRESDPIPAPVVVLVVVLDSAGHDTPGEHDAEADQQE